MGIHISWTELVQFFASGLIGYVLFRFTKSVFLSPAPSGPASIGRALGLLVLGESLGAYVLSYFSALLAVFLGSEVAATLKELMQLMLFFIVSFGAAYLSARTTEDVGTMNAKIFLVIGFCIHAVVTFLVFMQSNLLQIALWAFVPLGIGGAVLKLRLHNQALNQTQKG